MTEQDTIDAAARALCSALFEDHEGGWAYFKSEAIMNDNIQTIYTLTFPMPECRDATITKDFDTWDERSRFMRTLPDNTNTSCSMYRKPTPAQHCDIPKCPGYFLILLPSVGRMVSSSLHYAP